MERYICTTCQQMIEKGVVHRCNVPSVQEVQFAHMRQGLQNVATTVATEGSAIRTSGMAASVTGGLRDNKGKPRLSLVPSELEAAVAEVIWKSSDRAGGKYPLQNWRKGLPWSEVAESAIRHLKKFAQEGEDLDHETGLSHLAHAACNLAFLLWYQKNRPNLDDRHKEEK
jgi:hypothetical protein